MHTKQLQSHNDYNYYPTCIVQQVINNNSGEH